MFISLQSPAFKVVHFIYSILLFVPGVALGSGNDELLCQNQGKIAANQTFSSAVNSNEGIFPVLSESVSISELLDLASLCPDGEYRKYINCEINRRSEIKPLDVGFSKREHFLSFSEDKSNQFIGGLKIHFNYDLELSSDDWKQFFGNFKNLKVLDLYGNQMGDKGVVPLAKSLPPSLTKLNLMSNQIGLDGITALAPHLMKSNLTELNLGKNNLKDAGIAELAPCLPRSLISLDLASNEIKDQGLVILTQHLNHSLINKLNLCNNEIGPSGALILVHYAPSRLKSIDLDCNRIGKSGAEALLLRNRKVLSKY